MATEWSGFSAMTIGMPVSACEPHVEAVEQRAAAGEDDALLHDVGGQLGRRLVERDLDGVDDGRDRLLDGLADLLGGGDDRLGQPGDEVATPDLGVQLLLERAGRAEGDLDLLGGALAEGEAVLLLDELDDGLVELVAADADRLAGDDAAEGDDGHLGGAAADVDDHVAGGLVDGQPGADGRGHGLLDDVGGLAGAGVLGRLLHRPLLHAGDARGHADHHAGLRPAALVHPVDEVAEHLLADLEVGDHAVLAAAGWPGCGRACARSCAWPRGRPPAAGRPSR